MDDGGAYGLPAMVGSRPRGNPEQSQAGSVASLLLRRREVGIVVDVVVTIRNEMNRQSTVYSR